MKVVFPLNATSNYNVRNRSSFYSRLVNSVYKVTDSLLHFISKIREIVPNDIKALDFLPES